MQYTDNVGIQGTKAEFAALLEFRAWLDERGIPNAVVDNADDAVAFARTLVGVNP